MSGWLIALTGLIYLYISLESGVRGNWPGCIIFGGYAFSNIGLYLVAGK